MRKPVFRVFKKKRDHTICVAKTKALISCAVTAQLICSLFIHLQKHGFLTLQLMILMIFGHFSTLMKSVIQAFQVLSFFDCKTNLYAVYRLLYGIFNEITFN